MSKASKNDSQQPAPSGRIAFDERGKAIWEWRTDSGFKTDIDTQQVRALQESSDVSLGEGAPAPISDNPYSTGDKREIIAKRAPRRTLDDMRKLSEEIKRSRNHKK